ncbi:MAG: FKBP-type peptidyl-prolyl cis-trans isomerase [Flavobacteriales bacterium]|jgi:FKBP-type peptidyl-prolyl cis-trans isomerase FkpA
MKKLIILFVIPAVLFSCGGNKEENVVEEKVELKTEKDRLSYVLGAMNAKTIVGTPDPNIERLDMKEIAKGFNENLSDNKPSDCEATLTKLFGPNFQDFDSTYAKEGAQCLGRLTGYAFYQDIKKMGGIDQVDLKIAKIGFRQGLLKKDTLVSETDKQVMVQNFIKGLNEKNGKKMMAEAKKIPGAKIFDNGIILQIITEGKGGSPSATDDVKVEYILTSAVGDTVQSSYQMKKQAGASKDPVALKLNGGVIPGWTYIVPKMKKGGKYRVYIPWDLAYGEQMGRESLCFVIELIDYAKEGTFVKPQPQTAMPQGQGF